MARWSWSMGRLVWSMGFGLSDGAGIGVKMAVCKVLRDGVEGMATGVGFIGGVGLDRGVAFMGGGSTKPFSCMGSGTEVSTNVTFTTGGSVLIWFLMCTNPTIMSMPTCNSREPTPNLR